jgi:hypothetical protein
MPDSILTGRFFRQNSDDFVGVLTKNILSKFSVYGASPGFPVEFGGAVEPHAAFFTESRTRGRS